MTLINIDCNAIMRSLQFESSLNRNHFMLNIVYSLLSQSNLSLTNSDTETDKIKILGSITNDCSDEFKNISRSMKIIVALSSLVSVHTGSSVSKKFHLAFKNREGILDNYMIPGLSESREFIDVRSGKELVEKFSLMGLMDNLDLVDKETGLLRVRKPHKYPSFMEAFNLPLCYDNQINEYRHDNSIEFINLFYSDYILQHQLILLEDPTIPGTLKEPLLQLTGGLVLKTLDSEYKDVLLKRSKMTEVELKRKLMELEFLKK